MSLNKSVFITLCFLVSIIVHSQESPNTDIKIGVCTNPHKAYKEAEDYYERLPLSEKQKRLPPVNTKAYTQSIHNAIARWDSGSYYRFEIGTAPGQGNINRGHLLNSTSRHTRGHSYEELRKLALAQGNTFNIGDTFYFTLYETSNDVPSWVSPPLRFQVETLGENTNNLTINIETNYGVNGLGGFNTTQRDKMKAFYDLVNPIVKEVYGPPSRNHEVHVVNDGRAVGINIFYNGPNQISTTYRLNRNGDLDQPRLMIHELVHAYRDNVILSSDDEWHYSTVLNGFEEGMAEAVAVIVMDKFIERYPNFFNSESYKVHWGHSRGMPFDWDYDFQNHEQLTTTDFFSSDIGTGAHWERYGTSQAAMQKMYIEDPNIFKKFNQEYYRRHNANPFLISTRDLIVDIFKTILPQVERTPISDWINEQRVFDCKVVPGNKVHMLTFHSASPPRIHTLDNRIHVLQTQNLIDANEWSWDEIDNANRANSKRWYIQTNNLDGKLDIFNYNNTLNQSINIRNDKNSRKNRVPAYLGPYQGFNYIRYNGNFTANDGRNNCTQPGCGKKPEGIETHNFRSTSSNDRNHSDLPRGLPDPNSQIVTGLNNLGLYRYDISFEGSKYKGTYYRLHGQDLVRKDGILGGIKSKDDTKQIKGKLIVEHEKFGEEPEVIINNGAFISKRKWTGVLETDVKRQGGRTDRRYSVPGKVHVIYISEDCNTHKIDFRNITYGDGLSGSQLFLFTTENFEDIKFTPIADASVCENDSFTFNVTNNFPDILDKDSRITYRWLDPSNTEVSTNKEYTINLVEKKHEGIYTLEINFFGCTITFNVELTVSKGSFTIKTPNTINVCENETITIAATNVTGATYTWTGPNGFTANTREISIPNATTAMTGDYTVSVTGKNCKNVDETKTSTTKVTVTTDFTVTNSPASLSICENETITIEANRITGATYSWTGPNGFTANTRQISIPNATAAMTGDYTVSVTAKNCKNVDETKTNTTNVNVNNSFIVSNSPASLSICENGTITIEATQITGATYSWTGPNGFTANTRQISIPNATTAMTGDYTVSVTGKNCKNVDETKTSTTNVTVTTDFTITNSPASLSICENETITIEATQITGATYSWTGPNGFTANTRQISIPNATAAMTGDYTVSVTAKNCKNVDETKTSTTNVTVNNSFIVSNSPASLSICENETITIETNQITGATYSWTGPNGYTANTRQISIPNAITAMTGDYTVSVTAKNCKNVDETKTSTTNVTVTTDFTVTNSPASLSVCENEIITIEANQITGATYSWTGPNGFTANTRQISIPNAATNMTGSYIVNVTAKNCRGVDETKTANFSVSVKTCLKIPVFFTPNQDGINDEWVIDPDTKFTVVNIYNRFGKLLKQLTPSNNSWDGTYNGKRMPSTDYWYTINYTNKSQRKGHFSLLRK